MDPDSCSEQLKERDITWGSVLRSRTNGDFHNVFQTCFIHRAPGTIQEKGE